MARKNLMNAFCPVESPLTTEEAYLARMILGAVRENLYYDRQLDGGTYRERCEDWVLSIGEADHNSFMCACEKLVFHSAKEFGLSNAELSIVMHVLGKVLDTLTYDVTLEPFPYRSDCDSWICSLSRGEYLALGRALKKL